MQENLLDWYRINHRKLPFRESHDPYRIWVSEIMLQQTQMDTVVPYFIRFMESFPDVFALAQADEEMVFKAWEGLGYYSRAKNLQKGAKMMVDIYEGQFPTEYKKVLEIPGIGPYTAGAIMSIAFNKKYPAIDGNVMRVISRVCLIHEDIGKPKTRKTFEEVVANLIPENARDFNQALMELGALVCTPTNPKCTRCPIQVDCRAFHEGKTHELPVKSNRIKKQKEEIAVVIIRKNNQILLVKAIEGLLAGLWSFPSEKGKSKEEAKNRLIEELDRSHGIKIEGIVERGTEKHIFTHKTWRMTVYQCQQSMSQEDRVKNKGLNNFSEWVNEDEVSHYAMSTAFKKVLKYLD